ncbi:MAG: NAD(P)-dependent oxidoreductase [Hydrogenophaga sp.]|uniref:NAD-dependent epimerase/dehydratase family protein n=1 Tax=Hydrogenophaga sp. TaxID=1904254 RepID=UPI00271ECA39|nr:NAD(P)-dependent oxidoreductase [Hydrogenophaga sp.]MDO9568060.1 NAD(P)-dependent oxidoreductase [Hydrogenophaga sp.]MDP3372911.1 NAD(P)-dependent oxidoreductase [Hydrogenophaga sp.]
MNPKALITGATGYVGSKLSQRLLANGWQVDVLVRTAGRPLPESLAHLVGQHTYDGSAQSALDAVAATKPDVVFHLASMVIAEHNSDQITDLINSNLLFGTHLAEACVRNGVLRFINTGTYWQHYRSEGYDPVCLYAATKQAFEDILDFYADAFGLRVITLKLFDTYGPDDPRPKLVNLLVKALHSGEALGMSPGEQVLDLVHIDDVTNAFLVGAQQLLNGTAYTPHKRYAVSSGAPLSVRQLVALMEQVSGKTIQVTFGVRPYRSREVMMPWQGGFLLPGWVSKKNLLTELPKLFGHRN